MFYVYKIEWSQTDHEYVLFFTIGEPAKYLKNEYPRALYYHFVCKTSECGNMPK